MKTITRTAIVALAIAISCFTATACGDDDPEPPTCQSGDFGDVMAALPGDAVEGIEIFQKCSNGACHGAAGLGVTDASGLGTDLSLRVPKLDDQALAVAIRCGFDTEAKSLMPPLSELSATDIANVISHLRATFP